MSKALRWIGYLIAAFLLLVLLAAAWIWSASALALRGSYEGRPEKLAAPTPAQLADAPRQLQVLGCVSCHGEGLRGDLLFDEPGVATIHAPNLTLVAAKASDQQLARGLRQGIGVDGRPLFAMPSAQYARLTDAEVAALIGAIRKLPGGGEQVPPVTVGVKGRVGLALGKFRSQPEEVERYRNNMPADLGPQFARGRHLAMTNCAECHGPAFGGGEPKPGTKAPDLVVAGAYDLPEFRRLMRTGVPTGNRKLGLMADVARNDFSHFTDEEIAAIHAYLVERANRAR
ncbi:MAG TPA: cytochrome c [Sphingomicrobium sp.]|nr:cytochrome c [Sphingomicrobium sp.]